MSSDSRLELMKDAVVLAPSRSAAEVGSGLCRRRNLRRQLYFLLIEFHGTRKEEESRSDNQEQDDIDATGEVEYRGGEKCNRRRNMVVIELCTPCYGEGEDDEGICDGVT